ncbi:MAG: beta galactosidase jelly roll domain-containing protein [Lawsonella clevelandensis]
MARRQHQTSEELPAGPGLLPGCRPDANAYDFHEGDVWYRAHYTAATDDPAIWVKAFGAPGSNFLVWMNGKYVGASAAVKGSVADTGLDNESSKDPTANLTESPKSISFKVPRGTVKKGQKVVLSILLRNNGQRVDWEGIGNNLHAMGVLDARVGNKGKVTWKIQGARGGIHPVDKVRGIYNNGGLYGERAGWYLPGFPDNTWKPAATMHATKPGVTWYRSDFTLMPPPTRTSCCG